MQDRWILKTGSEVLGLLTFKEQDQPWAVYYFQAEPAFAKYESYFKEELRLLDLDDMTSWDQAYSAIDGLGLVLESLNQEEEKVTDFILHIRHIREDEAWLRRKSEQQTLGQIEPRGSRGVTGKGNNHSHPRDPRAPRG